MATILIVEDEIAIARVMKDNLVYEGYAVQMAHDGKAGLEMALAGGVDLILLDIMLPHMNGYDVCRKLREAGHTTPVIMLTAKGEEIDKVLGLELGADDYVTKPVGVRELLARIHAGLRRASYGQTAIPSVLDVGQARIDFGAFEAVVKGQAVHLSPKAFGVLKLLWDRAGDVVSRNEILEQVWGYDAFPTTRTVDNHIAELRAVLEADPSKPECIVTVHGVGYRLTDHGTGEAYDAERNDAFTKRKE